VGKGEAGACLADRVIALMRAAGVPNGVAGVGYGEADLDALTRGSILQKRLVDNAPMPIDEGAMRALFRGAISYW
jgi:hydroxyacid-oxoacid transhydrogenase